METIQAHDSRKPVYKKPLFWIILAVILAAIITTVCLLTVPKKDNPEMAEFVGTWEFYKCISDTYEEDALIATMLDGNIDRITFQEDGTGTWLYVASAVETFENPFTYTVSGNKVFITRTGKDKKPLEFTYDPESGMLRSPEDAGEGSRWYWLFVREGSITYPTVQLTNEQISGEWITDGLPIMEGKPLTLSGSLVFDTDGTAVLHLHGDNNTEMNVTGTYNADNSVIRFETDDDTAVLEYLSYFDMDVYFHLYIKDIKPEGENAFLASYDPQTDTIRIVVLKFGVLTFRRATPARSAEVMQWLDYYSEMPWEETKEITIDAFPNTRFRWTYGSVEAVEDGATRTLFSGMPVWNVFFADVTGDDKPELCASVSFGSGIVDEHIVVYDYANRQSYTLWDRGTFDYHLYTENGALLVGKTLCNSYSSDTSILDTGTLTMQDGLLCCRWSDGSVTVLNRELHESELYGKWLVEEDANDPRTSDARIEYDFREDGTVVFRQTPLYASYEFAFGYPVDYRYAVYDNHVHIEDGCSCTGYYDAQTQTLKLNYQPSPGQYVYATLRRISDSAQDDTMLDEATLCTIWMLAELEAPDGSSGDARALGLERYLVFRSDGTVRMIDVKAPSDRVVPYTVNDNTVAFDGRDFEYDPESNELFSIDPSTQDILFYTPAPNAVLPEENADTLSALREKYPEFFDLPTENELTVYVYQMTPNDLSHFGLLSGTDRQDNRDMSYLCKASLDEMLLILSDYGLSPDRIEIHATRNDLSSYHYEIDASYLSQIRALLFEKTDADLFPDQTVEELILGVYTCSGAMLNGSSIAIPDSYVGMQIDLSDSITLPDLSYYHFASVTIKGVEQTGYDWKVYGNNILTVWNEETQDTWTLYWSPSARMFYMNATDDLSGKLVVLIFKSDY